MQQRFFKTRLLVGSGLLLLALHAQAGLVVFTDRSRYLAALTSFGVDNLDDNPINQAAQRQARSAGSFGYTVSVEMGDPIAGNYFTATGNANTWLSPTNAGDGLNFGSFSPSVNAIGAYLFAVDDGFTPLTGQSLNLLAVDGTGSQHFAFTSDGSASFVGVVSDTPLLSFTVSRTPSAAPAWVVANEVVLGNAVSAVPEPPSATLLALGLAALAMHVRRKAAKRRV